MSEDNLGDFRERIKRLQKGKGGQKKPTHQRLNIGLDLPERKRRRLAFPWKSILLMVTALLLLKAYIVRDMGEFAYIQRIDELRKGTLAEKVASYVLAPDPLSTWAMETAMDAKWRAEQVSAQ